jgi:hypothetical protein
VPLPLELAGGQRPGIHDFRPMRTDGSVYQVAGLRMAITIGQVLQGLYQAHTWWLEETGAQTLICDFTNPWYQHHYDSAPAEL